MKRTFLNDSFEFEPFCDARDAKAALDELSTLPEIDHATYFAVNVPTLTGKTSYALSTYASDWHDRYFEKEYARIDPIVKRGLTQIAPFDWNADRESSKPISRFFGEAGEFGVAKQGYSVPIRGMSGDCSLFSLNSSLPDKAWQDFLYEHRKDILSSAYYFHMAVTDIEDPNNVRISLTARETEALKWAAEGKTQWETGMILSISHRTVEAYLLNARKKLRVHRTSQAITRAMVMGLI